MGSVNIVRNIKRVHQECVVMVKIGSFYRVYSKDAYIFSYLFQYKIKKVQEIAECGFPVDALPKVESILESNKVNYIVVDKRSNYEVEEENIDKQNSNYDKIFKKAKKIVENKLRIEEIYEKLMSDIEEEGLEEKLKMIEEVLEDSEAREF